MAFFKVDTGQQSGIVYLLYLYLDDGTRVVKIGITSRKIEERVVEILTSYFKTYRVFPRLYPKRFKKTTDNYRKEQALHKYFSRRAHLFSKPFDGSSEFFDIDDEDELLKVYEDCLVDVDINSEEYSYEEA